MNKKIKTDWKKVSKAIDHEDFFHKFLMHPESMKLLGNVKSLVGADLGCGNGIFISQLMKFGCQKMYAIDISSSMLDLARENNKNFNVEYIKSDITKGIDLLDNSCDFVTHIMLLHTIKDINNVIKESFRILKSNGICLVVTPHPFALMRGDFKSIKNLNTENYIKEQDVLFLWNRNGIEAEMEFYWRPLNKYLNSFADTGFFLENITEPPVPIEAKGIKNDIMFNRMRKIPTFLFLKFRKR